MATKRFVQFRLVRCDTRGDREKENSDSSTEGLWEMKISMNSNKLTFKTK